MSKNKKSVKEIKRWLLDGICCGIAAGLIVGAIILMVVGLMALTGGEIPADAMNRVKGVVLGSMILACAWVLILEN